MSKNYKLNFEDTINISESVEINIEKAKKQENIKLLKDVAEIIKPKQTDQRGIVIKTRNFHYPLTYSDLETNIATSLTIDKGDILFSDTFSGEQKFYLINEKLKKIIFPSSFLVVIRPKNISPEYLFLYLQSDTAKKYFLSNKSGGFFPRIPLSKLSEMPIVIPEKETQEKSKVLFENLFLQPKINVLSEINKQLFSKTKVKKPIQKEFLEEEFFKLKIFKKEILDKIIKQDFQELEKCRENKLYKSFLILAGSILEAFLLDWISEIESKDYFVKDSENFTLGKLIFDKLRKIHPDIFNEDLTIKANRIMKKRNLIHPKEFFNSRELVNDKICEEIVADLKFILNSRK